jgi:resuscitation-promoting factor RpfB
MKSIPPKLQRSWVRLAIRRRRRIRRLKILSRHPYAVPVITFFVLIILTVGGYLLATRTNHLTVSANTKIVIISHDHETQIVPSHEPTVGTLLKKLNIQLGQGDVVEPAGNTPIDQDEFRINIYRAVPVEIVDGNQNTFTFSAATTPRSIAEQAGITVYAADTISTDPAQNFLKTNAIGEQVVINRATPVNLNLYGTSVVVRTHAATVADLIKQENINLASTDQVLPGPTAVLTSNAQVFIIRKGTKIESVTQTIAMPVQTIDDPTLAFGTSAVRQQGSNGQQVITYQDNLQNNVVVSRTPIQTVTTQQAVTEIVVEGTSLSGIKGDMALAGIAPGDYNYADYIISHESGWCPTKAQGEHTCPAIPDNAMTSAGYGLCQATPGYKMQSAGSDWATNPITQLKWCAGYAEGRYGSWLAAYNHWVAYHNW